MTELNTDKNGLMLFGYDPTSYFEGKPAKGRKSISATYQGGTYYFLTEQNRKRFLEKPESFAPAYGGFCATAVSEGKYVPIHPKNYKITKGRLYLFYKGIDGDAKKGWVDDEKKLTKLADDLWKKGTFTRPPAPKALLFVNRVLYPY